MPDGIPLSEEEERILDRVWDRVGRARTPHAFALGKGGKCSACGEPEKTKAHATFARFTDQPMMVLEQLRCEEDYFNGAADSQAGRERSLTGTAQYQRGYEDAMKDGRKVASASPSGDRGKQR